MKTPNVSSSVAPRAGFVSALTLSKPIARRGRVLMMALAAWAACAGLSSRASAQMLDFADIKNWTGSGPNQAALVIDWNDGKNPESLVWGYRFSGTATGLDMFRAIDAADPRLVLYTIYYSGIGDAVYGIGYDLDGKGGTFTPGTPDGNPPDDGMASDPNDHYAEGFSTKYWAYYINKTAASPYNGGAWMFDEDNGAGTQQIVNGSWNGFSISDASFNAPDPGLPMPADAVPEPSTLFAAGFALVVVAAVRKRRVVRG